MKTLILLYLLPVLLILHSCGQGSVEKDGIPVIRIGDLWESNDAMNLSEIAQSIDYIVLEQNPDCILPQANTIQCSMQDEFLFVIPYSSAVHVFNTSGKFLFKVGQIGKGPGEYLLARLVYDETNKLIWIFDPKQDKLIKYSQQGVFLHEYSTEQSVNRIAAMKGLIYMLQLKGGYGGSADQSQVVVWDQNGDVVDQIPLPSDRDPIAGDFVSIGSSFKVVNERLYFNEAPFLHGYYLNDTDGWERSWDLDQGKLSVKPEAYRTSTFLETTAVLGVIETPNFLFLKGRRNGQIRVFVYDLSHRTLHANHPDEDLNLSEDLWGIYNDIDDGLPFWPTGKAGSNSYLQINDAIDYIDIPNGSETLMEVCKSLKPNDNPVVMVVNLK